MSKLINLFKIGDKVEIVNYGHPVWIHKQEWDEYIKSGLTDKEKPSNILEEHENMYVYDISPEMIGRTGIIEKIDTTQGIVSYMLTDIEGKHGWYNKQQLKLHANHNPSNYSFYIIQCDVDYTVSLLSIYI